MTYPGRFGGVLTAMATPFDADGDLDLDGAARLARWLVDHGSDALVVAGTTGEGAALDDEEKDALLRAVVASVTVPVVAATGVADTRHSIGLTRAAERAGAAGVLVVTPYYVRPSQAGLVAHFSAVAGSTSLPVLVYDIPARTGRRVETDSMLHLAREVPNIVGVKDASGDLPAAQRLMAGAPAGFDCYCGDDALTLAFAALGAAGVISVAAHWAGPLFAEMLRRLAKGDLASARAANQRLLASYRFQTSEDAPNPVPLKEMLRELSLPAGPTRPPMGPAPQGLGERARAVLDELALGS